MKTINSLFNQLLNSMTKKRFKEELPVKKEISLEIKILWSYLLETQKSFTPYNVKKCIELANTLVCDRGEFKFNKNLEIEFKMYE